MNLRDLALLSPPPNPYRLVILPGNRIVLTDVNGDVLHPADGAAPVYMAPCDVSVTEPTTVAEIAVPRVEDVEPVRGASGLSFDGKKMIGMPNGTAMAVEAGIRLLREPVTNKPVFKPADRAGILAGAANGIGRRACDAAFAVYNLADAAGNVSASPSGGATTTAADSGASAESLG